MAVSATKDFWIHPNALTITLNYFDDPQLIQTSMLAGAVIMAYNKNYIGYDAAHNYREWKLQAFPTQLNDTCAYYVHAELSRDGDTAMIIYSPVKRDIEGRSFIDGAWDSTTSSASWFVYLGEISASVDADGATVERVWTDGLYTGTLATDQQRLEDAQGDWALMFQLNSATGLIDVLKTISNATINAINIVSKIVFGGKTITGIAGVDETEVKVSDATLPTTAYTSKHFLIKDQDIEQDVKGDITFDKNVKVKGDNRIEGNQFISGNQEINSNQTINGDNIVKGTTRITSDKGLTDIALIIGDYIEENDIIQGAAVTKGGVASFAKVKAPSMQIYELYYNRKTAVQGEFIFSDGDTVDTVTYVCANGDRWTHQQVVNGLFSPTPGSYAYIHLGLSIPYDGYFTSLAEHDILYANINNIAESGSSAKTGKCFMRVLKDNEIEGVVGVDNNGTALNVLLYPDEATPTGENMLPTPRMTITRHGNEVNTDRQDIFIISSEEGRLAQLTGVDSPIIHSDTAYGIVLGRLPYNLIEYIKNAGYSYLNPDQPYLYARGAVIQDLIRIDYKGKVIKSSNYRGTWVAPTSEDTQYRVTETEYDTVTHNGSLWQCNVDMTTEEPRGGINDWLLLVAKGQDPVPMTTNILNNTSFTKVDAEGNLEGWTTSTTLGVVEVMDKSQSGIGANALLISKAKESTERNILRQTDIDLATNSWYTISFFARSMQDVDAVLLVAFNYIGTTIYINGERELFTTGGEPITVTPEWKQYYLTFQTNDRENDRTLSFSHQSGNIGDAYAIAKIKLEYASNQEEPQNALPSAWMESSEDLRGPQGNGVTIVSTDVSYSKSDSGTIKPTSWVSELPTVENGMYLWTRTMVTYSDGNITDTYTVSRMGVDGRGIKSSVVTYSQQPSPVDPESIDNWGAFPDTLNDGEWLYTRTRITYYNSDGTDGEKTDSYTVSQIGVGSYYAGLQEWYAIHDNDSTPPEGYIAKGQYGADANLSPTGIWSQERPKTTTAKPYLWNFSISRDSRDNAYVTDVICIGNFAKGIVSIKELYAISQYSEPNGDGGYPTDIESWEDEQMNSAPTKDKPYQWNQTATTYNDGTIEYVYHVSAVRGDDGEAGAEAGATYNLIPSADAIYVDNNGNMTIGELDITVGETTPHGYYEIKDYKELNNRGLFIGFSFNGTNYFPINTLENAIPITAGSKILYLRLTSVLATKTYQIKTIPIVYQGDTGVGISDIAVEYAVTSSFNQPTVDSAEWKTDFPTNIEEGKYLWVKTQFNYTDTERPSKVTISVSKVGAKGESITVSKTEYQLGDSPTTIPTGTWREADREGNLPFEIEEGKYLWTKFTFSDGKYSYTSSYSGKNLTVKDLFYAITDTNEQPSDDKFTLTEAPKTVEQGKYIWTKTVFSDGKVDYAATHIAKDGVNGNGIKQVLVYYATSTTFKQPTTGWKQSTDGNIPNDLTVNEGDYLWRKEVTDYTDEEAEDTVTFSVSKIGANGTSVKIIKTEYAVNNSPTSYPTSGWKEATNGKLPYEAKDGQYLWTKTTFSEGDPVYTSSKNGEAGASLTIVSIKYVLTDTNEQPSDDKFSTTIPTPIKGKYEWTRIEYSDKNVEYSSQYIANDGLSAITLHAEPSSINVLVDAQDGTLIDIYNTKKDMVVYARDPFGKLRTDDYSLAPLPQVDMLTFSSVTKNDDCYSFSVKVNDNANRDNIPQFFTVDFVHSDGTSLGSLPISISISERGFVGPAGDNGAMLLPYGYWSAETAYKLLLDSNGKVVGRPLVYYVEKGATKGTYFVLQKDIPEDKVGEVDTSDSKYWAPFEEYKAIYTEALMADYAKFGDDNGAIFFKQFLFSQRGQGNKDYSNFLPDNSDENTPIFTTNEKGQYELSGSFNPKLHLDFLNGLANLSCLCEPYVVPEAKKGVVQIDMESGFNIKIPYNDSNLTRPVLVLPKLKDAPSWYKNGAHVEIMYESGGSDFASHVNENILNNPATAKGKFILICVDNPCDNDDGIVDSDGGWAGQSYIMCRGKRAKYLILGVGGYVRFRAVEVGNTTMWYVTTEGNVSEEKVDIYSRKDGGELGEVTYDYYNRVQFYGSDYSVEINMQEQQEGVTCRSLMLYSGPEGLCPRNIKFTSGKNLGYPHYEVVPSSEINYYYEADDGEYLGGYGPILGD